DRAADRALTVARPGPRRVLDRLRSPRTNGDKRGNGFVETRDAGRCAGLGEVSAKVSARAPAPDTEKVPEPAGDPGEEPADEHVGDVADNEFVCLYTGVADLTRPDFGQSQCLAVSRDLVHWRKHTPVTRP